MNAKAERVIELYKQLITVQQEENRIARQKRAIKDQLANLIPSNSIVGGVKRTVVEKRTTSWKEVAEASKMTLVPKTKWEIYDGIVKGSTKISTYDRFTTNGEEG